MDEADVFILEHSCEGQERQGCYVEGLRTDGRDAVCFKTFLNFFVSERECERSVNRERESERERLID